MSAVIHRKPDLDLAERLARACGFREHDSINEFPKGSKFRWYYKLNEDMTEVTLTDVAFIPAQGKPIDFQLSAFSADEQQMIVEEIEAEVVQ